MANKIYAQQLVIGTAQIVAQPVNLAGRSGKNNTFTVEQAILDIFINIADFRLHVFRTRKGTNICNRVYACKADSLFRIEPNAENRDIVAIAEKGAAYVLKSSARGALELVAR